jgi:hypothetical protein
MDDNALTNIYGGLGGRQPLAKRRLRWGGGPLHPHMYRIPSRPRPLDVGMTGPLGLYPTHSHK